MLYPGADRSCGVSSVPWWVLALLTATVVIEEPLSSRLLLKYDQLRHRLDAWLYCSARTAETAASPHNRLVAVQPHALDGNAPALVGPLPVLTLEGDEAAAVPGGLQEFLQDGDRVVDVAVLRCQPRIPPELPAQNSRRASLWQRAGQLHVLAFLQIAPWRLCPHRLCSIFDVHCVLVHNYELLVLTKACGGPSQMFGVIMVVLLTLFSNVLLILNTVTQRSGGISCTVLVIAGASGRMAALLVAAEAAPHWADAAPQCILGDDGGISATRCEARVQPAREDGAVVLIDVADLQVCASESARRPAPRADLSHAQCLAVYAYWCFLLNARTVSLRPFGSPSSPLATLS